MALITPPFSFADVTDNLTGTPDTGSAPGTGVVSGASSNSDGTPVTLLSALAHDVHYLQIGIGRGAINSNATNYLLDILVDPAGGTSWSDLISDIACGFLAAPAAGGASLAMTLFFPIWIPAGASIGAQGRCSIGALTKQVFITAYGNPSRPDMWWCGQGVETLGVTPASSVGTTITPGASGGAGTYTDIGASTYRYGAVQFSIQGPDNAATAKGGYWNIGIGSARLPGSPTIYTSMSTAETLGYCNNAPIWCDVPAGTTFQIAGTLSGTAEDYNGAVYGVY